MVIPFPAHRAHPPPQGATSIGGQYSRKGGFVAYRLNVIN